MLKPRSTAAAAALLILALPAAAEVAPGDVVIVDDAIEAPLTDQAGDPVQGLATFVGRRLGNCLACHQVTSLEDSQQFHGEVGPSLDGVADLYSAAELRSRVVNPKTMNPDTIMPAFYVPGSEMNRVPEKFQGTILTAQQVEDVVAYLQTLTDE